MLFIHYANPIFPIGTNEWLIHQILSFCKFDLNTHRVIGCGTFRLF